LRETDVEPRADPPPAKLVVSALFSRTDLESAVIRALEQEFGPVDLVSERIPFARTRYYEAEMGSGLQRRIISFGRLIPSDGLVKAKLQAQDLEDVHRDARGHRRVNLDPGALGLHNVVLATRKGYTHRVYLGRGVYADLTLLYGKGGFRPLAWTYPDYASSPILDLMEAVRGVLRWQLRNGLGVPGHAS
jgi:hypothetical protein